MHRFPSKHAPRFHVPIPARMATGATSHHQAALSLPGNGPFQVDLGGNFPVCPRATRRREAVNHKDRKPDTKRPRDEVIHLPLKDEKEGKALAQKPIKKLPPCLRFLRGWVHLFVCPRAYPLIRLSSILLLQGISPQRRCFMTIGEVSH